MKWRERTNSTNILEFMQNKKEDKEAVKNKRKRKEIEKQAEESFKKCNMMQKIPKGETDERKGWKERGRKGGRGKWKEHLWRY